MNMPITQESMGEQMPQEEMRSNLLDLYGKVKERKGQLDAAKGVGEARVHESKAKAVEMFFKKFQEAGIDPSDPEAMRAFFDKLYQTNPDLYEMMVPVIDSLLGPEEEEGMEGGEMGMMGGEQMQGQPPMGQMGMDNEVGP